MKIYFLKGKEMLLKNWPILSILLVVIMLTSMLLFPAIAQPLAWMIIAIGLGMAVLITVQKQIKAYREGRIKLAILIRNIGLDILALLITFLAAIWVASKAATYIYQIAQQASESVWSGSGPLVCILAGFITGLGVGLGVGIIMQWILSALSKMVLIKQ
jgi:hypothetical protein